MLGNGFAWMAAGLGQNSTTGGTDQVGMATHLMLNPPSVHGDLLNQSSKLRSTLGVIRT